MKKRIYQQYICRKNVSGGIIALYVGGGIALESYLQKQLYEHTFPQLAEIRFLSWPCFTSSVGRVSFPQLAEKLPKEDYCCMKKLLQATQD